MESQSNYPPLVVILGQTASGKSALALDMAERWNGEIVAADSRTVYKGMDIGTAKPSLEEQRRIPHHLLDVVRPDQRFTVGDFKPLALQAVDRISLRGRVPFLVGGTGLYIDAILYDFRFRGEADFKLRRQLVGLSVDELRAVAEAEGILLPANMHNVRHIIRAIESGGEPSLRGVPRGNTLIIGIMLDRSILEERVTARTDAMLSAGLAEEALGLADRYGWDCPPMSTIGYREFQAYAKGEATITEVRQAIITHTMQYAKRQKTWFKRNKSIQWISKTEEAVDILTTFLNK